MKKYLAVVPLLFVVGCAGSPEKTLVTASNGITAATNSAANLTQRDRITIPQAKSVLGIVKESDNLLTLAETNLVECRKTHPKPEIGLDPCATNPELILSSDILIRLEQYLKEKEGK